MTPPRLMTVEEIAEYAHSQIPLTAVRAAIRDGKLDAKKLGKRYYATEEAVIKWMTCPGKSSLVSLAEKSGAPSNHDVTREIAGGK